MQTFVGHCGLKGDFQRYARQFNFLELVGEASRLPKRAKLRAWGESAPDGFRFSVVLPAVVGGLGEGEERDRQLAGALEVAGLLSAAVVVVRSPASVRPSSRSQQLLEKLFGECRSAGRVAWEPAGLWEPEAAQRFADAADVTLVRDPLRGPVGERELEYWRVRALGISAKLTTGAAESIAESVEPTATTYIAVEGGGAALVKRALSDLFGGGEDVDEESDEETEDG